MSLKQQLEQAETKNKELQHRFEDAQKQAEEVSTAKETLEAQSKEQSAKQAELQKTVDDLTLQAQQIGFLTEKLQASEADNCKLQSKINTIQETLMEIQTYKDQLQDSLNKIMEQHEQEKMQLIADNEKQIRKVMEENANEIDELNKKLALMEEQEDKKTQS